MIATIVEPETPNIGSPPDTDFFFDDSMSITSIGAGDQEPR